MYKVILATEKSIKLFKDASILELARNILKYYSGDITAIHNFEVRIRIDTFSNKEIFVNCKTSIKDDLYSVLSTMLEQEFLEV